MNADNQSSTFEKALDFFHNQNYDAALDCFQQIVPEYPLAYYYIGYCFFKLSNTSQSLGALKKNLSLHPQHVPTLFFIAHLYFLKQDFSQATEYLKKIHHCSDQESQEFLTFNPRVFLYLLALQFYQGNIDLVIRTCQSLLEKSNSSQYPYSSIMSLLIISEIYLPLKSNKDLYKRVLEWGKRFDEPLNTRVFSGRACHRRLRIGYLSQEFSDYSSSLSIGSLFKWANQNEFEIYAYCDSRKQDKITDNLRNALKNWKVVSDLTDLQLCQLIQKDKIDILVDLGGHTHNYRLKFYSFKPAPLQVTGLGFGMPTGIKTMDYFITDPYITPHNLSKYCREKLVYLPCSLIHWSPPSEVLTYIKKKSASICFGSGNTIYKLNHQVIDVWAKILKQCPNSILKLKAMGFSNPDNCQKVRQQFQQQGISPERIYFYGKTNRKEHLEFYQTIDIALNPFPCPGGISTCDAIWMGKPIITLNSGRMVAVSILSHLNLKQWIANTVEEYVEKALYYTQESRQGDFRERLLNASICNEKLYVKHIENLYKALWKRLEYQAINR